MAARALAHRRDLRGLGALGPTGKQVALGVTVGLLASVAIYFGFFFAPAVTKAKGEDFGEGEQ